MNGDRVPRQVHAHSLTHTGALRVMRQLRRGWQTSSVRTFSSRDSQHDWLGYEETDHTHAHPIYVHILKSKDRQVNTEQETKPFEPLFIPAILFIHRHPYQAGKIKGALKPVYRRLLSGAALPHLHTWLPGYILYIYIYIYHHPTHMHSASKR